MKYIVKVTEIRSYLLEIEAENMEMANSRVLERVDRKTFCKPSGSEIVVEFKKNTEKTWGQR